MQPVVIDLIQAVMHAVRCDCRLIDTHSSSNQLENPVSRPDCILVSSGDRAQWTQVVSVWEFKIGTGKVETETMYGQQVERCRAVLDSYSERTAVVAVNVTMNTLEVITVEHQPDDDLRLSTTGRQPFSISTNSPGFQLLVQLLSTPKAHLGFATPLVPTIKELNGHCLELPYLINQGSAHQGCGSWVFQVKLKANGSAILKLSRASLEVSFQHSVQCVHLCLTAFCELSFCLFCALFKVVDDSVHAGLLKVHALHMFCLRRALSCLIWRVWTMSSSC